MRDVIIKNNNIKYKYTKIPLDYQITENIYLGGNMKKREIDIPNSPEIKKILIDFCNAKMSMYNYTKEEFEQKTEKFFKHIKKMTVCERKTSRNDGYIGGSYNYFTKELLIYSENIDKLSVEEMFSLVHELNHIWNFEPHKRKGIIPQTAINSQIKNRYYFHIWDEAINEAETQVLCYSLLRIQNKENTFKSYPEEESIFEMLCIISNQTGINFLKDIEGKNILEIIEHISNQSKVPEEEVNNTILNIATLYSKLRVNARRFNFLLGLNMKASYAKSEDIDLLSSLPDMNIKEGQQIYEILKNFIKNSGYNQEEKDLIFLKLEALIDRMSFRFFPFRI